MSELLNKTCPIKLTPGAIKELKGLIIEENETNPLRIGVKNGGCSGFSYILNFEEMQAGDNEYEVEGIKVIINPLHLIHLQNLEIDFQIGLDNRGFIYNNPNAESTCGCGTSFS